MQELEVNAIATILIGPFVDKTDGVTPEEGITLAAADSAEVMKHDGITFVDIAGAGGNQAILTHREKGMYTLSILAAVISDEGRLTVFISDESVCLPVWKDFMVVSQAYWASKYTAKDSGYMDVDIKAVGGTATPHTSGKLHVLQGDGNAITAVGPTNTQLNTAIALCAQVADGWDAALATILDNFSATRIGYLDELDFGLTEALSAISAYVDCLPAALGDIVTQTEAHVVDAVWDEALTGATHNIATSAGRRLRQAGVDAALIREDTCQGGGTASNVILDTGASGTNNYYDHMWIYLTAGTGAGQVRTIHAYVGNTFTGDIYPDWLTTPDATSEYAIISLGSSHVHELENLALAQINAELDTALADIDLDHLIQVSAGAEEPTDGSYLDQVMHKAAGQAFDATTDSLEAIRDRGDAAWITGGGGTAADIADAVWDELLADHQTADTMGEALADATEITIEED